MMTINQMAQALNVSRQTIYNVVKDAGLSIDDLTTEKQGKTRLFDDKAVERVKQLLSDRRKCKATTDNTRERQLSDDLDKAREEIEKLKLDLERANNRIDALLQTNMALATKQQALPAGKEPGRLKRAWLALTGKADT